MNDQFGKLQPEKRLERKYTLAATSLESIEPFLIESGFVEAYPTRTVHSVYFDSLSRSSYTDAMQGHKDRLKVRWRWYDFNGDTSPGHLELKIKSADVVKKYTISNKKSDHIKNKIESKNFPQPFDEILASWQVALKNSYQRAYYQHAHFPIRVTVDINLSPSMEERTNSEFNFSNIILEIKYPVDAESFLHQLSLFKTLPLTRQRFSKFVLGINNVSGMI